VEIRVKVLNARHHCGASGREIRQINGGQKQPSQHLEENVMAEFDFIVVGGGSAGAVIASRLSEDTACRVALIEAGERPPEISSLPIAPAAMQLNPTTDWMYTADPGKAGLGLNGRRIPVPRGKMLGGSSGINYMVYVRGHPGDFDSWAEGGATGWSYAEVLPYFRKSEGMTPSDEIVVDAPAHNTTGPLGVSVRAPLLPAAQQFVEAAVAAGIPRGDYNGRDRGGATGFVSLTQTTTRGGKRSSTYVAFLAGEPESRSNLTIITGALATRILLEAASGQITATGVEYRTAAGETVVAHAAKEVILSAGAVGSPQLLLLSGIGPQQELDALGVSCLVDSPHVGKHLRDHLMCPLVYPAPDIGVPASEIGLSMGPDALRAPAGPLPADPVDDAKLSPELQILKQEAERRLTEWRATGRGLASSSLVDAVVFCSTGLGDLHSHDTEIMCFVTGANDDLMRMILNIDTAGRTIPVKWGLTQAAGAYLNLDAVQAIWSTGIICPNSASSTVAGDVPIGLSGLKIAGGDFQFNWATDRSWSGSCRRLYIRLSDGTTPYADFQLK
jgi:hypothetical protein